MNLRKVWAIARKEARQASRDPLSLAMLLGLPTIMLLMYGYAIKFDVRHVRLAVRDLDKTEESRSLVASFVNSTYFDQVADVPAGTDVDLITEPRVAKAVLAIPEGFARTLSRGRTATVQLLLDGADANTATTVLGYATALAADANLRRFSEHAGVEVLPIGYEPPVFYNPELRTTQFLVPGLVGFILMLTAVVSTALSVVREKERGTMEQLRVTSLTAAELLVGKTLPYLAISLMATVIILTAARVLFGVVVRGPYLDLFVATLIYLVGALGWGLLVSSIAETQALADGTDANSAVVGLGYASRIIAEMGGSLQKTRLEAVSRRSAEIARRTGVPMAKPPAVGQIEIVPRIFYNPDLKTRWFYVPAVLALVLMIPMIYLSGLIFPIENMPMLFQIGSYGIPVRYYGIILRGVFLKGSGLDVLWPEALTLTLTGFAWLTFASPGAAIVS